MQQKNELLSGGRRIRRGAEWPRSVERERARKLKYPRKIMIKDERTTYILRCRKSRWIRKIIGEGYVRERDLFCWLMLDKCRVGALHFIEFEPDIGIDNEVFLATMDVENSADAQLAEVLCSAWQDVVDDVLAYGPVLEFRLAWMSPKQATSAVWARAAEAFITTEFDDHSILVMKAFPLEY